jgi:hypothetical protein
LTPRRGDHSISPESSDGFASVGTILPKEKAALLPGGLFTFSLRNRVIYEQRPSNANIERAFFSSGEPLRLAPATIQSDECQADVAQLVEQLIRNQQVIGSSPIVGSSSLLSPRING